MLANSRAASCFCLMLACSTQRLSRGTARKNHATWKHLHSTVLGGVVAKNFAVTLRKFTTNYAVAQPHLAVLWGRPYFKQEGLGFCAG